MIPKTLTITPAPDGGVEIDYQGVTQLHLPHLPAAELAAGDPRLLLAHAPKAEKVLWESILLNLTPTEALALAGRIILITHPDMNGMDRSHDTGENVIVVGEPTGWRAEQVLAQLQGLA